MRERWAIVLAVLTGMLVVLASAAFAAMQNPGLDPAPVVASVATPQAATAEADSALAAADHAADPTIDPAGDRGRAVYQANGCARCHQLAGEGSPRSPLDGVGGRRAREELRHWVLAEDAVADELSKRAFEAKMAYRDLPLADLEALLDYLEAQK